METTNQIIAREGYGKIAFLLLFLLFLYVAQAPSLIFYLSLFFTLFVLYVYRNPERIADDDGDDVYLSPIDGKVVNIESGEKRIEITIVVSLLDVHLLRSPVEGYICRKSLTHGAALSYECEKSSYLNERADVELCYDDSKIAINFLSAFMHGGLKIYKDRNIGVKKGSRIGFFLSGRVTFSVPLQSRLKINIGDRVVGAQSVVGYFS